jgi:hypothetical protein
LAFQRRRLTKDRNDGYPRYLGVRAKVGQPTLRVVSSNNPD